MTQFLRFAVVIFLLPAFPFVVPARAAKHAPARKTSGRSHGKVLKTRSRANRGRAHKPVQHSQAAPTSDRYREIQQALAAKGYLKTEPTGVWDAGAENAMRRFQADQKLAQTGRINSLSLISLGLGPKTKSSASC